MKRNLILTAMILCIAITASAQNTFIKGDKVLNLSLGVGNTIHMGTGYSGGAAISASYEVGIIDNVFDEKSSIGVGAYIGHASTKIKHYSGYYRLSDVIISSKGAFHYQLVDKLDTYAGLLVGFRFGYDNDPYYDNTTISLIGAGFAGARYYFNDTFAAMAEIGYGIAVLNLGIALKF